MRRLLGFKHRLIGFFTTLAAMGVVADIIVGYKH